MHRLTYVGVLLALLLTAQAVAQTTTPPRPLDFDYAKAWAKVDSLDNQGLPQQARVVVDSIYAAALAEPNEPQFIKTLFFHSKYTMALEENAENRILADVRGRLAEATPAGRALLHSILGELFLRYAQNNRYQLYNRTATTGYDEDDIATWDLTKLMTEATTHYLRSVESADTLRALPVEAYDVLMLQGGEGRLLRPTLFDFLAHRAIDFLTNQEASVITPERAFFLQEDHFFAPASDFIGLDLDGQDGLGVAALRLLQDLLAFHLDRDDPASVVDVDLRRLKLIHTVSVASLKDSLYAASLEHLRTQYAGLPVFADITFVMAQEYDRRGDRYRASGVENAASEKDRLAKRRAMALCDEAIARFPGTPDAGRCRSLQTLIRRKELTFEVEDAVVPDVPVQARLAYRNVQTVHVKTVPVTHEERRTIEQTDWEDRGKMLEAFAQREGIGQAPVTLPDDGDFQHHAVEIKTPPPAAGLHLLLAGTSPAFESNGEALAYAFVQASPISFVSRQRPEGSYDVYVMNRATGQPLRRARIRVSYQDPSITDLFRRLTYETDRNGYAHLKPKIHESFRLSIEHQDDELVSSQHFYTYRHDQDEERERVTHFFTDRAIYRPGQTIYFKGIAMEVEDEHYTILPGARSRVQLYDPNRQEMAALDLVANDYGTFSGSFVAPQGGLNGQMSIAGDYGSVYFSVEEYKRPRFEVSLDIPEGAPLAGDTVTVTGTATSYAGASLDGAQVAYRVVRHPYWRVWHYGRWGRPPHNQEVEISRGVVETSVEGAFTVPFVAHPDLTIPRYPGLAFNYRVEVDVTDITGETHSAQQNVVVGYAALSLTLSLPSMLDKTKAHEAGITSANLNGSPEPVQGRLVVMRLRSPDRLFRKRLWEAPDRYAMDQDAFYETFPYDEYANEANVALWPVQDTVLTLAFDTAEQQRYALRGLAGLPSGAYRVEARAEDPTGLPLLDEQHITLFDPAEKRPPFPTLDWFAPLKTSGEPGETAAFLIGTGAKDTRVLFEVEHRGTITEQRWLRLSNEQQRVEVPIEEKHRGNFTVYVTFVKHNRSFARIQPITVPHTNKKLAVSLATFRNKLYPGSEEEWKIKISGPDGEAAAAELVAAMYDVSLETFRQHGWSFDILPYRSGRMPWDSYNLRAVSRSELAASGWNPSISYPSQRRYYDALNWFGFYYFGPWRGGYRDRVMRMAAPQMEGLELDEIVVAGVASEANKDALPPSVEMEEITQTQQVVPPAPGGLGAVQARRNLNETAFFFPHLETNAEGEVLLSFTMPEALTRWRMLALAHTKDLKFGQLTQEVITQKELMVTPNAPRFFREADTLLFTAKIANLSDTLLSGRAQLMLFDALTMTPLDAQLGNTDAARAFVVAKGASQAFTWPLTIPEGVQAVTYRVVAEAGAFSDGEEAVVPVLTNRMLVTESLPLPVRGNQTKTFRFDKLADGRSPTLRHHRLTLEYTPNPVWYAVQALPYMMEFPYECAEQVFSRYYANSIAAHVVAQNPKIERIYDAWRQAEAGALVSNLEKNQELKALLLEETPWVLHARDETARKKRIGLLFDGNHMRGELSRALRRLEQMTHSQGGWPWFDGMPPDRYITQHIVTGMGHLQHLGVLSAADADRTAGMLTRAAQYLDTAIRSDYDRLIEHKVNLALQHIGPMQIQYLYARSFYPDIKRTDAQQEAFEYYLGQARTYWLKQHQYLQGMTALALHRYGDAETPMKIIRSLKEFALHSEEMGMYWKSTPSYWWHQAPIETQALLIEAFHEIADDKASVEAMQQWLLKQKQTQDWGTTKATAEATYALLLRGIDLTAEETRVAISLGEHRLDTATMAGAEAGTGYFKTEWTGTDIAPSMGQITVEKQGDGIAWGAVYWQYFEQLDRITTHETPLRLEKQLLLQQHTDTGPLLMPLDSTTTLTPGDLLKARIVLHADRDFEYVHMKDMRAAGLEPLNVLSGYRYQDGLGYYESTRDAATHFFFGYLPKGTYVFEYPLRVNHAGAFSNGITTIQAMYAPEFTAHSEGIRLRIGPPKDGPMIGER